MRITKLVGVLLIMGVVFNSCELLEELGVDITTDNYEDDFQVEPKGAGTYLFYQDVVISELKSIVEDEGFSLDQINSVQLHECIFSVNGPDDANFNAFGSLEVVIFTDSPETGEVVATIDNLGVGLTEVTLMPTESELIDYLSGDDYNILIKGVLDEDLTYLIDIHYIINFDVEVGY